MSAPTVNRRDISLEEEHERATLTSNVSYWTATLSGALSTGEEVRLSRSGSGETAAVALASLEAAIAEQGWTIRASK